MTLATIPPKWLAGAGANFARTAKVTVSSTLDEDKYPPSFINDGKIDIRNNNTRWVSKRAMPQHVEFVWDKPVTVNAVRIVTGWSQGTKTSPVDMIRNFNFQHHDETGWKDIAAVDANHRFDFNGILPETTTDRLRLKITAAGGETARLWEVEFYHIDQAAKTLPL